MRIELLTVADCPNRDETLRRLGQALRLCGLEDAVITDRRIEDDAEAAAAGMTGSPTVLVDGRDPLAEAGLEASLSCRLYHGDGRFEGAPSVAALARALRR